MADRLGHDHVFLGAAHERNERRAWTVIVLCGAMMLLEIAGGVKLSQRRSRCRLDEESPA